MSTPTARDLIRVASGCGGTGVELAPFADLRGIWFSTRTLTLDPRPGGVGPAIAEVTSGFVHGAGEPNPGLEAFAAIELPALVRAGTRVLASISGGSAAEIVDLARRLVLLPGLAGVELNLSPTAPDLLCPRDHREATDLVAAVRDVTRDVAVHTKVGPEHGPGVLAAMARESDAVVISGSSQARTRAGLVGQLSGPAVLPVTLARVAAARAAAADASLDDTTLIAVGGISSAHDVRALLDTGADAVQMGTALLHDPTTLDRTLRDLEGDS